MNHLVMLLLSFFVLYPNIAGAQVAPPEEDVLLAVVEHLRTEVLPDGSLRVHPEFLVPDTGVALGGTVPDQFVSKVGADGVMRLKDAMDCASLSHPRTCTLRDGASAVLALSRPDLRATDEATVLAKMTHRTGLEDRPLSSRTMVLHLEKRSGEWVVVRTEVRRIT